MHTHNVILTGWERAVPVLGSTTAEAFLQPPLEVHVLAAQALANASLTVAAHRTALELLATMALLRTCLPMRVRGSLLSVKVARRRSANAAMTLLNTEPKGVHLLALDLLKKHLQDRIVAENVLSLWKHLASHGACPSSPSRAHGAAHRLAPSLNARAVARTTAAAAPHRAQRDEGVRQ
jgi:hypothetical protein